MSNGMMSGVDVDVTGEKQGGKFCGCCCDYRRAVVVLSVIGIVLMAILIVLTLVGVGSGASMAADAAMFAVIICFYIFQLDAALKYNVCMLGTVVVFHLLAFVYNIWETSVTAETAGRMAIGIVITGLWTVLLIYPTVGLIMEINSGIMSPATYPREAHSFCC